MELTDEQKVRRKNGGIVMDALNNLQEPATLMDIVRYVAETQQIDGSSIKESIKDVLTNGVESGFLQKCGAKYCVNRSDSMDFDEDEEEAEDGDDDVPSDRSRRRRSRKGRSRSRKRGSRSRSRRRR